MFIAETWSFEEADDGMQAVHSAGAYEPGSDLTVTTQITYVNPLSAIGVEVDLPEGWTFVSVGADDVPDIQPSAGATGMLGFAWIVPPAGPIDFIYTVHVPDGTVGYNEIRARIKYRRFDGGIIEPVQPDPMMFGGVLTRLEQGFNLIAIPEDVTSQPDLRDCLPMLGDSTEIEKVMVYDNQAAKFITLIPGGPPTGSFVLDGSEGGVVYAKQDKEVIFNSLFCSTYNLKQGFNLMVFACPSNGYSAFQLLNDLGSGNVSSVQRYSPEKGAFETAAFRRDGRRIGVDFPIIPGEGYFLFMKQENPEFGLP